MPDDVKPIPDDCALLRRITPNQIIHDANIGKRRLSSGAFRDPQMSVDAECLLAAAGHDWRFSLGAHPAFFLVRFTAGFARQQMQTVQHYPVADNPFHAVVAGRKSNAISAAFRDVAEWVKKPDGV